MTYIFHPSVPPPDKPNINKDTIKATSDTITLSWSLDSNENIKYSVVVWQIDDSGSRPTTETNESEKIDAPESTYTIQGLKSNTVYTITVTVFNPAGSMTSPSINVSTEMGN